MLALCLPLAVAGGLMPSATSAPLHAAPTPESAVSIRHVEASQYKLSLHSYPVTEVRLALERAMAATGRVDLDSRAARVTLSRLYGSRSTENTVPMGYTMVWDPVLERWVWVCSSTSTFSVDFAARGTVEVVVRESERVP
jgi:hypothetical protein